MLDAHSRRESLHRRLDNTSAALDSVQKRKEALVPAAQALLARSQDLIAFARQALRDRWAATEHFPEPGRDMVRVIACDNLQRLLQELSATLLPALRGANSTRIPVEMVDALEAAAQQVSGAPLSVVVYAAAPYNYSIQWYGDPLTELAPYIAPFAPPPVPDGSSFLFLSLPELERDSATLHAIALGHEIGHLRDWVHDITAPLDVTVPASWSNSSGSLSDLYAPAVPLYREVAAAWAQEIVSDVFAALVLGPASLFALVELLSSITSMVTDSPTHPAGDRRVHVVLTVLDTLGFEQVPELVPVLQELRRIATDSTTRAVRLTGVPDGEPVLAEAANEVWLWLQAQLPTLFAACRAVVPEPVDVSSWNDVVAAAEQLDHGQPCGERIVVTPSGTQLMAVRASTIMNAAWLSRVRRHPGLAHLLGTGSSPEESAQLHAVVDGLVLKSLEVSATRAGTPWS